jgi:hypothetical protein
MAYFEYVLFVNVILQSFSKKIFPSAHLSKRTFPFPLCSNNKYQLYTQTTCILQRNHIPDFKFEFSPCCKCSSFFWVIPRRLCVTGRRFGTLYWFHLHRQVDEEWLGMGKWCVFTP